MTKDEILTRINEYMNENETVKATMSAVADLQTQADNATGSKRDDLVKQLRIAEGAMKQAISENVVLPVYSELQKEFSDIVAAAGFLAAAWQAAYAESFHELNMHQFPALSCANAFVAGLVKGA